MGLASVAALLIVCHMRSAPASTGYSPFTLLFGRHPQGVLDVLQEDWGRSSGEMESHISVLEALKDNMKKTVALA